MTVIANLTRPRASRGIQKFIAAAAQAGISLLVPPDMLEIFPGAVPCFPEDFAARGAQGVVSLGGDGSLLAVVHAMASADLPFVGLNAGHLGYLTAANEEGFASFLYALARGRYVVEQRTTLEAQTCSATEEASCVCKNVLNDVVITRLEGGRAFALQLYLNDTPVARYLCDGLIVATPTGSTAYSLSVGGPVVAPTARVLVISVIAPHMLSARPLIIPDDTHIRVTADKEEEASAVVHADGIGHATLAPGEALDVSASLRPIRLIMPEGQTPYGSLSRKLGWSMAFTR